MNKELIKEVEKLRVVSEQSQADHRCNIIVNKVLVLLKNQEDD